jgi:hypothetical protein
MELASLVNPKCQTYEDLVTACLTSSGYFVEANLHLREENKEILELDVIATPYSNPIDGVLLLEAKSGDTGINDLFKLFGWRTFLGIPRAYLVRSTPIKEFDLPAVERVASETGITVATLMPTDSFDWSLFPHRSLLLPMEMRELLARVVWHGRIAKRMCLAAFTSTGREPHNVAHRKARDYRWAVEQCAFEKKPLERIRAAYEAFHQFPFITKAVVEEEVPDSGLSEAGMWSSLRNSCRFLHIQFCLMIEHTARLRIAKNLVVHANHSERSEDSTLWQAEERRLPSSCRKGLGVIQGSPHRNQLPYLWQLFIEVLGGFYSTVDDCDLTLLSQCTEIPTSDIEGCLDLYARLFPSKNGWWVTHENELKMLKHVPGIYHGTGVLLRAQLVGRDFYEKRHPRSRNQLRQWEHALHKAMP